MQELWNDRTPDNTQVVVINWRDIRSVYNWQEDSSVELRPCRDMLTVGWLLYEGDDPEEEGATLTVLAGSYDAENDTWSEYTFFPHMVKKGEKRYDEGLQEIHTVPADSGSGDISKPAN